MTTSTLTTRIEALNPSSSAVIKAAAHIEAGAPLLLAAHAAREDDAATEISEGIRVAYNFIASESAEAHAVMDVFMDDFEATIAHVLDARVAGADMSEILDELLAAYPLPTEATSPTEAVDPAVTALIEEIETTTAEALAAYDADSAAEAILTAGTLLEEAWPAEFGTDAHDAIEDAADGLRDALRGAWETWAEHHVQERVEVIEVDGHEVEVTWKPIDITANSSGPADTFDGRVYAFDHSPVHITDPGWDQTRIILETEDGEEIRLWGRGSEEYNGGYIASSYFEEDEDAELAPGGYRVTLL